MFGKQIMKMALAAFPPEKIKTIVTENADPLILMLDKWIGEKIQLTDEEEELTLLVRRSKDSQGRNTLMAIPTTLNASGFVHDTRDPIDLRMLAENADYASILENIKKG